MASMQSEESTFLTCHECLLPYPLLNNHLVEPFLQYTIKAEFRTLVERGVHLFHRTLQRRYLCGKLN